MTNRITATAQATNEGLYADLREPTTKTFKNSPRGLMAAVDWLLDQHKSIMRNMGNLSGPRLTLEVNGAKFGTREVFSISDDLMFLVGNDHYGIHRSRTQNAAEWLEKGAEANKATMDRIERDLDAEMSSY